MVKNTRIFDHHRYELYGIYDGETAAKRVARTLRKGGNYVRIVWCKDPEGSGCDLLAVYRR